MNSKPFVTSATVRDGGDEWHIECRMADGQKYAAVTVDKGAEGLADAIAEFLNGAARVAPVEPKALAEAVKSVAFDLKFSENHEPKSGQVVTRRSQVRILLRHARAPRLSGEQSGALVSAVARLRSHGTERDDAVAESLRAAFAELGEVEG